MPPRHLLFVAIALLAALPALAALRAGPAGPSSAAESFRGDPSPLDVCPVSGEKLGKDAVTVILSGMKDKALEGVQVRFCCPKCETAFKGDPAKYLPKMEEEIIRTAAPYPLAHCLVMPDEKLDESAKTLVYQNRVYKLCCKKCVGRFTKDPEKYAKEYEAAVVAAQKPGYKAKSCPISGKPLGEGAVDVVVNGRLVRACCPGCVGPIKADPKAAFAKIDS